MQPPPPPPPFDSPPVSGLPPVLRSHTVFDTSSQPPPPPPPPVQLPDFTTVSKPSDFIPVHYSGDSLLDRAQVVCLTPFELQGSLRRVMLSLHGAQLADFAEYKWIIQYGDSETWYERPSRSTRKMLAIGCESVGLTEVPSPQSILSGETPKVWASSALTTPTDDDVYDCDAGHHVGSPSGACYQCTDEKSEALESTSLVYYLVLSTGQLKRKDASGYISPSPYGMDISGKPVYKLVKFGTREAAAAEAFYVSGSMGWNVVFSCVLRFGETFDERTGPIERVDELWKLGEDAENENTIRIFY